uniref:Nucleoprotein n=1 Tax=Pink bollworm virus 3 TaxID=2713148 RepID=A0A6G6C952_9VIRU|nr:nucleoprotein [Pink bollworm virus 3]
MANQDANWELLNRQGTLGRTSREIYEQAREIIGQITNPKDWVLSVFGYAGFDILKFREEIKNKIDTAESLYFLIIFFLIRGNNIARIKETTANKDAVDRLKSLETRLKIKSKAAGKTAAVTLSRIAISFPEIVAVILTEIPEIPGAVRLEELRLASGFDEFPSLARQPALACFIPKITPGAKDIINVFLFANMTISETINASNEKWNHQSPEQRLATTIVYQKNAWNSNLYSEEERIKWCIELNIMSRSGAFSAAWNSAALACKSKLDKHYGGHFS